MFVVIRDCLPAADGLNKCSTRTKSNSSTNSLRPIVTAKVLVTISRPVCFTMAINCVSWSQITGYLVAISILLIQLHVGYAEITILQLCCNAQVIVTACRREPWSRSVMQKVIGKLNSLHFYRSTRLAKIGRCLHWRKHTVRFAPFF